MSRRTTIESLACHIERKYKTQEEAISGMTEILKEDPSELFTYIAN